MAAAVGTATTSQRGQLRAEPVRRPARLGQGQLGKAKFGVCAACHGNDGKGNQALGAPNLTDDIWLHGAGRERDRGDDQQRQDNAMPAQADKFTGADQCAHGLRVGLSNKTPVAANKAGPCS
jgi:cytochrome c oxidase cbb3-type subunit 3